MGHDSSQQSCTSGRHAAGRLLLQLGACSRMEPGGTGTTSSSETPSRLKTSPLSLDAADWAATHRTNPPRLASGSCWGTISVAKPLNDVDPSLRRDLLLACVRPPLPSLQPEGGLE